MISSITIGDPSISDAVSKPVSFADQTFPYNSLPSPRRFEELLYSIYGAKIRAGIVNGYDKISIMGGVRDSGRDCALLRMGKNHGLIQCKQYGKNYGKSDFGQEITRFVLYSLLDERLVHDYDDFTYLIAVSKGFTEECRSFIDDFSNQIASEPNLTEWINKNLLAETLKPLSITIDYEQVRGLLQRIRVEKIVPQDLDSDLALPCCKLLIPQFFTVRTVTDNSLVEQLIATQLGKDPTTDELLGKLSAGSMSLHTENNTFQNIGNSHVERRETMELLEWIQTETVPQGKTYHNVCLLTAQAGYGKTVVLHDLYEACREKHIPVLGLKADKLYSNTLSHLQDTLGLSLPVYELIEHCSRKFERTVILIDQIDALSQSMASDRSYMQLYQNMIDHFAGHEDVRFIVSVRTSDLHYDSALKNYKKAKYIELGLLDVEQVVELLGKINISRKEVSPKLLELLRIPNYLNVFSQIAHNARSLSATTVQEIYSELWRQKVRDIPKSLPVKTKNLKAVLYAIAQEMYRTQRIAVPEANFEDDSDELHYLHSERLVKIEDRQLQFFHQSFYDFVFSKQFVENRRSLLKYILDGEQSIRIRSAVKMILSYLREYDPDQYAACIREVFSDTATMFHIQQIIVASILEQQAAMNVEEDFINYVLEQSIQWRAVFFEIAFSENWLIFSIGNGLLENAAQGFDGNISKHMPQQHLDYARNAFINYLRYFICSKNTRAAWEYLAGCKDRSVVQQVLAYVENWENPISKRLLTENGPFLEMGFYGFFLAYKSLSKADPELALEQFQRNLPLVLDNGGSRNTYEMQELLRELTERVPSGTFRMLLGLLDFKNASTYQLYTYQNGDLDDDDDYREFHTFRLCAVSLRKIASSDINTFIEIFEQNISSSEKAVLRLLCYALTENPAPYGDQAFDLFMRIITFDRTTVDGTIDYENRVLLGKAFIYFSDCQQRKIIDVIANYSNIAEISFGRAEGGNRAYRFSYWGQSKYYMMLRLPLGVFHDDNMLRRQFQELQRRFKGCEDRPANSTTAGIVSSPIPNESCAKMNKSQWLRSFAKYKDNNRDRFGRNFLKGGMDELARAFEQTVKNSPSTEKLEIICAILDNPTIELKYAVLGCYGWVEGKGDPNLIVPSIKRLIERVSGPNLHYLVSMVSKLVGNEKEVPEFVDFLIGHALSFASHTDRDNEIGTDRETSISGLVTEGINTVNGNAAWSLPSIRDRLFEEKVFAAVEQILSGAPRENRATLYHRFLYLTYLNRDRAVETFQRMISAENDIYVIAASLYSYQYLWHHDFLKSAPAYEKLISSGLLGQEDCKMLFTSFLGIYLKEYADARQQLQHLIENCKYAPKTGANVIIKNFRQVDGSIQKNRELLQAILHAANKDETVSFELQFSWFSDIHIVEIEAFLQSYVTSRHFTLSNSFIDYCTRQIAFSVTSAIELYNLALRNQNMPKNTHDTYKLDEKSIVFIVSAFNGLTANDNETKLARARLLKSFDTLLRAQPFMTHNAKILDNLA